MRAQVIWWILRLAVAMCFVGHGAFGIITKAWVGAARGWRGWFERVSLPAAGAEREALVRRVLVLTTVVLLVGHGGLALQGKPLLVAHAEAIGFTAAAVPIAGGFELVLAALVLLAIAAMTCAAWGRRVSARATLEGMPP